MMPKRPKNEELRKSWQCVRRIEHSSNVISTKLNNLWWYHILKFSIVNSLMATDSQHSWMTRTELRQLWDFIHQLNWDTNWDRGRYLFSATTVERAVFLHRFCPENFEQLIFRDSLITSYRYFPNTN